MARLKFSPKQFAAWYLVHARDDVLLTSDQQYWYQTAGSALATLLAGAQYSEQDQLRILYRFAYLVAPFLGPAPEPDMALWPSFMTDDHTPIELSWDFHTGTEPPTIRYSIEPISPDAGTCSNPYNAKAGPDFRRALLKTFPDTDTTCLSHFEKFFCQPWDNDVPEGHLSTVFWAFDLRDTASTSKAYFFPGTIARATKQSNLAVVTRVILSAPGFCLRKQNPLGVFVGYVEQHPQLQLEVDMLALDLVPIDESRFKIYFRDRRTSFASVRENMSLGGQIQGEEFEIGMQRLKTLWDALMSTRGLPDDTPLPDNDHRTAGILYNVEFRAQSKQPKVKIYIPVRHYARNDEHVVETLIWFLSNENNSQSELRKTAARPEQYQACLHGIFNKADMTAGSGIHTYIGCSVQNHGKLRVVSYINPQVAKFRHK
ncbi:4-O-dimethylallyl-L-tyrosine synthase [Paramyrothecium foliicola]|nr:4-O-dimethylallyl-L-tyrosine synthase [Paramyrothecium foliicola]